MYFTYCLEIKDDINHTKTNEGEVFCFVLAYVCLGIIISLVLFQYAKCVMLVNMLMFGYL